MGEKLKVNIGCEITGDKFILKLLEEYAAVINKPKKIYDKIIDDVMKTEIEIFRNQGSYEGREKWKDLSPWYKKKKDVWFPGQGILVRRGLMKDSLTNRYSPNIYIKIDNKSLIIESKIKDEKGENLVNKHREGFTFAIGKGQFARVAKVPPRDPMSISDKQAERISNIITDELNKKLEELMRNQK